MRAEAARIAFTDRLHGPAGGRRSTTSCSCRNDGAPAYKLAVVVDDAAQGIGEVVRGADLLDSTPRQLFLARPLGLPEPTFAHVPLVLGPDGARLAKRHGAVTLPGPRPARRRGAGWRARSGLPDVAPREMIEAFDPGDAAARADPVRGNRLAASAVAGT